jgi:hypothetical protein
MAPLADITQTARDPCCAKDIIFVATSCVNAPNNSLNKQMQIDNRSAIVLQASKLIGYRQYPTYCDHDKYVVIAHASWNELCG